jgi:hypothetical protein
MICIGHLRAGITGLFWPFPFYFYPGFIAKKMIDPDGSLFP